MEYTPEQIKDITEREKKAIVALTELQLTPAAQVIKTNIGNDIFADKVVPFLQDSKYTKKEETTATPATESPNPVVTQAPINTTNEATPKA